MSVLRLADQAQVEELISELWRSHSDEESGNAWMGEKGFGDAVCEIIDRINIAELKLPREG